MSAMDRKDRILVVVLPDRLSERDDSHILSAGGTKSSCLVNVIGTGEQSCVPGDSMNLSQ